MGENRQPFPHKTLGSHLRAKRESIHESLAEVSGAVEIDIETLTKIEQGILLPSEDILLLLINHLDISEEDAVSLWELAGYDRHKSSDSDNDQAKQMFMVIPFDNRVLYTDDLEVTATKHGFVLNFMQSGNSQPTTIARIGMSREYARDLLNTLNATLAQPIQEPKMLPKPQDVRKKTNK